MNVGWVRHGPSPFRVGTAAAGLPAEPRRRLDGALGAKRRDLRRVVAQFRKNLLGMLAEQRRTLDLGRAVGELDRVADAEVLAARRVVDLDDGAGLAQRRFLGDLLHRQDRPAGNVVLVEDIHGLELGLGPGPFLDRREDLCQARQPGARSGVVGVGDPILLADHLADRRPDRGLGDEVDVGVGIVFPTLALEDPAGLAAPGGIAGARHGIAELAVRMLRVFRQHAGAGQSLLVAQLDPAQVQYRVLHRRQHALSAAARNALIERGDNTQGEVHTGAAVADLGRADQRRAVVEAGRRGGATGALGDVLVDLAVGIRPRAETLDRSDDHARIELLDPLPGEAHSVQGARSEVLDQHVATPDQGFQNLLALRVLGIDGDRALVVVQHREVETVHAGDVAQLSARRIAFAGLFHLDDVGAEPGQQLRAGRSRLDVGEIEDADSVQSLGHGQSPGYLYMVWALVPGAYSRGSTQMLMTAQRRVLATASRARRSAGPIRAGSRTSSPYPPSMSAKRPKGTSPSRLPTLPRSSPYLASWP